MSQNVTKIITIFIIGIFGGIFGSQILWPLVVQRSVFYEYDLDKLPQPIIKREEIIVQENKVLQQAIAKVDKTVVAVQSKTLAGRTIQGNGLALTSDGLIVTLANLVPQGSEFSFSFEDKSQHFQILKRDLTSNLALVKLEAGNIPIATFRTEPLELGERVFMVGVKSSGANQSKAVNEGIIILIDDKVLATNIQESVAMAGSPVFDIAGRVVGLTLIDSKGNVTILPVDEIRSFAGL